MPKNLISEFLIITFEANMNLLYSCKIVIKLRNNHFSETAFLKKSLMHGEFVLRNFN